MKPSPLFLPKPMTIIRTQPLFFTQTPKFTSNVKPTIFQSSPHRIRLCPVSMSTRSVHSSSPVIESDVQRPDSDPAFVNSTEEHIEKAIYGCRFMTLLGVLGSLVGSFLCFVKGCTHVISSFMEYSVNRGKVILLLVDAIDVYLLGTVMLVFGMGLYELFVSNLDSSKSLSEEKTPYRSNLFGLFTLKTTHHHIAWFPLPLVAWKEKHGNASKMQRHWVCAQIGCISYAPYKIGFKYQSLMHQWRLSPKNLRCKSLRIMLEDQELILDAPIEAPTQESMIQELAIQVSVIQESKIQVSIQH